MDWKKVKAAFSNAFAYDDGRGEISDEDLALLDKVAQWVVKRRLVAPAVLVLESSAPLNFVGSSLMTFFRPVVGVAFGTIQWERFEALLEKRCSMRLLVERIEKLDAEYEEHEKTRKAQAKKKRKATDGTEATDN